jgi:hypothetical protein
MQFRLSKARLAPVLLLLSVPLFAADPSRPVCSAENQGHMWPEAANHDPKLLSRLARCGELFICVRGSWHYNWQAPSVRFDQLGRQAKSKGARPTPPGCEVQASSKVQASSETPPAKSPASGDETF